MTYAQQIEAEDLISLVREAHIDFSYATTPEDKAYWYNEIESALSAVKQFYKTLV